MLYLTFDSNRPPLIHNTWPTFVLVSTMIPPLLSKKKIFLDETLTCHQRAGKEAILPVCDLSEYSWAFSSLTLGNDQLD